MTTRKRTLLVVDDNPAIRRMLAATLAPAYDLLLVSDGRAAIQLCEGQAARIDGIITDLDLPREMEGDFLASLAEQPLAVPLLVISRDGPEVMALAAQAAPVLVAWLPKPFYLTELQKAVRTLFGQS